MEFRRYPSIENSYQTKFINGLVERGLGDNTWVVNEKIHGANFSLWFSDTEIRAAKRSGFIEPGEKFHNYREVVDKYTDSLANLKDNYCPVNAKYVVVFGELFGPGIQKGVYYGDEKEFMAFDVATYGPDENGQDRFRFWDVPQVCHGLEKAGFLQPKELMRGTLYDCLAHPNAFNSTIPAQLGITYEDENICEGVVIKPLNVCYMYSGERVILKNKNAKWSEKASKPKTIRKQHPKLSPEGVIALEHFSMYITTNRLANVLSHLGEVTVKDFAKVMGLLSQDAFGQFVADNPENYDILAEEEKKLFKKMIPPIAAGLIRENMGMLQ